MEQNTHIHNTTDTHTQAHNTTAQQHILHVTQQYAGVAYSSNQGNSVSQRYARWAQRGGPETE